jgi:hypothetical protein
MFKIKSDDARCALAIMPAGAQLLFIDERPSGLEMLAHLTRPFEARWNERWPSLPGQPPQ